MCFFAMGSTGGRSKLMHLRCGCFFAHFNAKQAGRAADVAERLEFREIKFVRERLEVDAREAGHRAHELFQPGQVRVEFLEHSLLAVLDFVLRFAGAQRFGKIVPEFEEPRVEHDQNAADVTRAGFVEEQRAFGRVEILRLRAVAFAAEKLHRHERVEKIGDAARVEFQFRAQLRAGETAIGELREEPHLDGGEQDFGMPKSEGGLQDG